MTWLHILIFTCGAAVVLLYLAHANWWRLEAYLEDRRVDRLIRQRDRGER
jgi:hypothetical protein